MTSEKTNFSLNEIIASLPKEKNQRDAMLVQYFYRPISFLLTWAFLKTPVSANAVSYISGLVCIISAVAVVSGERDLAILGAIGFHLFGVLDCVDGNIARLRKSKGEFGAWADAIAGYIAYATVLPAAGIAVTLYTTQFAGQSIWIIAGFVAAIATLLTRLSYQKMANLSDEPGSEKTSWFINIHKNLGIAGLLMPLVLLGILFNLLHFVVAFYAVYYGAGMVAFILKQIYSVEFKGKRNS